MAAIPERASVGTFIQIGMPLSIICNQDAMKSLSGSRAHKFRSILMLHRISLRLIQTLSDRNSPVHRGKGKWERRTT
jgi:hypothetical protein